MNLAEVLKTGRENLVDAGFSEANLEAEVLLRHVFQINRAQLYASLYEKIAPDEIISYHRLLSRRLTGESIAYITGHKEFYGLEFFVDQRVLIPRPETEMLVDRALKIASGLPAPVLCDVGTGGGAIAVAFAKNNIRARIYAIDISPQSIEVAKKNAHLHTVEDRITFVAGDLLENLAEKADIITANLPYVKRVDVDTIQGEPALALDGGIDGLDVIRRFIKQIDKGLKKGGTCLLEIGEGQHEQVVDDVSACLPDASVTMSRDFAGIYRMVSVTLP